MAAALSMTFMGSAMAQSFRVQCPTETPLHPAGGSQPGSIKCQHIGGGDGYATMGDGHQIYLFGFAPLSGLGDPTTSVPGILTGQPGTQSPTVFKSTTDARRARIEPADIMNNGVLYSNAPAPMMAIDEDDEFFLTLSNVGMIMRPDLFEQHTVHFHGYPNASAFFDGVPDASVAINIAGSFTYYYTAPDAGTYFWHCHIAPPEHLQMGMVGQLFVRPRQNRVPVGASLYTALLTANNANRTRVADTSTATANSCSDLLCTGATPLPAITTAMQPVGGATYAYNDGDGSTRYDYDVPIQMMGFDPNFHFVGMTFNPEAFADMKDKYFLLNGRSYPDTINANVDNRSAVGIGGKVPNGPMATEGADGASRPSQPLHSLITLDSAPTGKTRALLRLSNLSVTEHTTLATLGIPMKVIAQNARLLRDMAGNNMYYDTNSITMGGGESTDVILDATGVPKGTYFLYSTNLDHLSNDAENFGGMMTEIVVQ
ncbi:MAG: multicopper oxidase domain-containing protein [Rhodoferax sp.]|uniref:multicopper oxidase domain-containing protein n=1 Tax=Rhodoferax sp. TaxID=50421 RepID=UPI003018D1A0